MTGSLSTWLQLREHADAEARSVALTRTVADALSGHEQVRVLDLGTGAGSNLRYLIPHLPGRQDWLVVDRDPALLAVLPDRSTAWGAAHGYEVNPHAGGCAIQGERLECRIETRQLDLGSLDSRIFAGRHLVTASALLDLVSESWLRELATCCRAAGAAALFTITYDGQSRCVPAEPEDEAIRDLLNRHQLRDKGLGGPAAGPAGAACAVRCFAEAGYRLYTAPSDWSLDDRDGKMQQYLVDGWAEAAIEMGFAAATVTGWRERRLAHIDAGRSRIVVGHLDIAALP